MFTKQFTLTNQLIIYVNPYKMASVQKFKISKLEAEDLVFIFCTLESWIHRVVNQVLELLLVGSVVLDKSQVAGVFQDSIIIRSCFGIHVREFTSWG